MGSGDQADTDRKPKPSGRRAKKISQQEQSDRFIETARALEADESDKSFEKALRAVVPEHKRKS